MAFSGKKPLNRGFFYAHKLEIRKGIFIFAIDKEKELPHQSRLGNSSNKTKCRDNFLSLMAGLIPQGSRKTGGLQKGEKSQILSIGVSSHSLMWHHNGGKTLSLAAVFCGLFRYFCVVGGVCRGMSLFFGGGKYFIGQGMDCAGFRTRL